MASESTTLSVMCGDARKTLDIRPWHSFLGFALPGLASETALTGIAANGTIGMVHILREHSKDREMADKLPVIIDNRGDNSLLCALRRLLPNLQKMDIGTGVFEIGSFLLLEGLWQNLDTIRIVMGDETTRRTKREIVKALLEVSNESIEREGVEIETGRECKETV